jgi:Cu+-exporting ATPase
MEARALDLQLTGMTCAACAARIEKVLNRTDGVRAAVNFATETAHVEFDAEKASEQTLIEAVRSAGYDATPAVDPFAAARARAQRRGAALSARALAIRDRRAPYAAARRADGGNDARAARRDAAVWLQFALAAPVQFWAGARFYSGAWKALRGGAANMDVLVALGTSAAFAFSVAVWLVPLPTQHVYFEASAVVITLVLLGKLLEGRARRRRRCDSRPAGAAAAPWCCASATAQPRSPARVGSPPATSSSCARAIV